MILEHSPSLGTVRLKNGDQWSDKRHGLCFIFVRAGVAKCLTGTSVERVIEGDILVFTGDSGAKVCSGGAGEVSLCSFCLPLESVTPLFAPAEIALMRDLSERFKVARIYPGSSPLASRCHRLLGEVAPAVDLEHRGQLLRIAAAILSEEFKTAQERRPAFAALEQHAVRLLKGLSETDVITLSVTTLASKLGCSRRHLNRLFHQYFGCSVAALRMEIRLLKAAALLYDPNLKIIDVAERCGFHHLGLFNTCFKKRFGVPPGKWRAQTPRSKTARAGSKNGDANCTLHAHGLCPWSGKFQANRPGRLTSAEPLPHRGCVRGLGSPNTLNRVPMEHEPGPVKANVHASATEGFSVQVHA